MTTGEAFCIAELEAGCFHLWAPRLIDHRAIAHWVGDLTPGPLSHRVIQCRRLQDRFRGHVGALEWVELDLLRPTRNRPEEARVKVYAGKSLETMPPILVFENGIEDGHARVQVARAAGATRILAYVIAPPLEV